MIVGDERSEDKGYEDDRCRIESNKGCLNAQRWMMEPQRWLPSVTITADEQAWRTVRKPSDAGIRTPGVAN